MSNAKTFKPIDQDPTWIEFKRLYEGLDEAGKQAIYDFVFRVVGIRESGYIGRLPPDPLDEAFNSGDGVYRP